MEFYKAPNPKELRFVATKEKGEVSALLALPKDAKGLLVLGHGAGSNMRSPLLEGLSQKLGPVGGRDVSLPVPLHGDRRTAP